ncbi:hypothetical protein ASPZODRAFT_170416 [Penicilliopsis zonata CBS 506.65]|uniref:Uncharacterized protein n=1 Tax=Penicilliopsis zonata CBS 506.65 TaxID=1073090 RepID=A0A1L9S4F0_9EURO|nr:hypothetical protein ASPZODRAFT_170416 [Penicilliopsis zonata CBS 506.65]OJJ42040.1 hypothetical protein ASPZODRAFT_170416 [Penicilliopsis zonata CBS 506.65]
MKLEAWVFKYPIPRTYRNVLASLFESITTNSDYYGLSDMLLSGLTASEIALIVHFLGITEQFLYANKYLNPLRDIDPSMAVFESFIEKGCRILILGNDILDLMERIQLPGTYWSGWIAEVEANDEIILPPKIWILLIPPDRRQPERIASFERAEELFDPLIQLQKGNDRRRATEAGEAAMWSMGVADLTLQTYQFQRDTQWSEYMCTMGKFSLEVGWNDSYRDIQSNCALPYMDINEDPHTISFSENDTSMEYKWDTHCGGRSIVLWKKKYSLSRNMLYTGGAIGENGRGILDEVDLAFKFPFEGRPN